MTIDRIRYFCSVVETRNLRKAAQLIGISPSSLSKALSVLQEEFGAPLIRPEGRGLDITEAGMRFYRLSLPVIDEFQRFQRNLLVTDRETADVRLKFGTFEVFSSHFAAELIRTEFPDREIFLRELIPTDIESALIEDTIEYGLTYIPSPSSRLDFTEVGSFKMGIYGLPRWCKLPFDQWDFAVPVSPLSISAQEHVSLDLWPKFKRHRRIKYEFELLETALQTTASGISVIHCPDFVIKLFNQRMSKERMLVRLPYPAGMKEPDRVKIFCVSMKDKPGTSRFIERTARFLRSLK